MDWHNEQLGEIVAELESKLTPDNRANYQKLVVAGMKAAQHKGPDGILYALSRRPDDLRRVAEANRSLQGRPVQPSRH